MIDGNKVKKSTEWKLGVEIDPGRKINPSGINEWIWRITTTNNEKAYQNNWTQKNLHPMSRQRLWCKNTDVMKHQCLKLLTKMENDPSILQMAQRDNIKM